MIKNSKIGKRYGRLTVINIDESKKGGRQGYYYICKCDCGNTVSVRGNILGKLKYDDESVNVFDDDDMNEAWKRFQIGWQIGVGANFNTFYVSASYGTDFSEIFEEGKVAMPSLTIGFNM